MGLEIVRDVLVKISLQLGDTSSIQKMATETTRLLSLFESIENKSITPKTGDMSGVARTVDSMLNTFNRLEEVQRKIISNEQRHNQLVVEKNTLGKQTLNQLEMMNMNLEKLVNYQREASRTNPTVPNSPNPPTPGPGPGFLDGGSIMSNPVFRISSAVMTVLHAPTMVLGGLEGVIKGLAAEVKGGKAAEKEGFFTAPGTKFLKFLGLIEEHGIEKKDKESDALQGVIALERQRLAIVEQMTAKEVDAARERLALVKQEEATIRSALEQEKARLAQSKQEFGLMTSGEQQTIKDIASKIKQGGIGSLSEQEIEFARKFSGIKPIFSEFAEQNADAGGFDALAKMLGATQRVEKLEADLKVKIDLANQINLEIKDMTKLAEEIAKGLQPLLEKVSRVMIGRLGTEINELMRKIRNHEL